MAARKRSNRKFDVIVASDGSAHGRAALATGAGFCWPESARLHAVVVRELTLDTGSGPTRDELEAAARETSEQARVRLARHSAQASAALIDGPVGPAILAEARRRRARVIVVGSRGHGALRRLVLGSTSRFLVREASCPVLVVRDRPARGQRVVLGFDGSAHARRAAAFLCSLAPARGASVLVLAAIESLRLPNLGAFPAKVRANLRAQAAELAEEKRDGAQRAADAACRRLERAGWNARTEVCEGVPLDTLLDRATSERADLLALGARGTGGVRRLLLGSVADGALQHAPCAVLITR